MAGKKPETISYFAHEAEVTRMERANKRLWIVVIILIAAIVASWVGFFIYESQFEDVTVTQENEGGYNNYIGNDGDIINGEIETDDQNPAEENGR